MSFEDGFRVEVVILAPRDAVWRALTDLDEVRRWFGWDYEGLEDEIRMIFVDEVTQYPPDRIALAWDQTIELIEDGPRTIVRIVKPGPLADADWDEIYDEMVRGWNAFFLQLRRYVEHHPGQDRRTLYLEIVAPPTAVLAELDRHEPGATWLGIRHQRVTAIEAYGRGLVAVLSEPPLDSDGPGRIQITLTTHGLDDAQFGALKQAWLDRWRALSDDVKITT